jgi:hypothetical protein
MCKRAGDPGNGERCKECWLTWGKRRGKCWARVGKSIGGLRRFGCACREGRGWEPSCPWREHLVSSISIPNAKYYIVLYETYTARGSSLWISRSCSEPDGLSESSFIFCPDGVMVNSSRATKERRRWREPLEIDRVAVSEEESAAWRDVQILSYGLPTPLNESSCLLEWVSGKR